MSLPLFALFLASFAFGTAEFVIAGVLPEVAVDLGVSVATAGYLVTAYAVGVALGGPLLILATGRINRKRLVVGLGIGFVLGQALCAMAPSFELLIAARIFVSVLHGAYFGVAFVLASGIVPPARRGFAMALVLAGLTVSNVLGVPGGTAIGQAFGWRATFWAVGLFGLVATLVIAVVLPGNAGAAAPRGNLQKEFAVLRRQQVASGFLVAILVMVGQYSLFTYIAPLLREVTGLPAQHVPLILLLYGIGSTLGVFVGGRLADWRLVPSLIAILVLQTGLFAALYLSSATPWLMITVILLWGGANFAFGSPLQSRMLLWAADAPNFTAALIPAGFNVGIAIGAALGAGLLDAGTGYGDLPLIGLVTLALSAAIVLVSHLAEQRSGRRPPRAAYLEAEA